MVEGAGRMRGKGVQALGLNEGRDLGINDQPLTSEVCSLYAGTSQEGFLFCLWDKSYSAAPAVDFG